MNVTAFGKRNHFLGTQKTSILHLAVLETRHVSKSIDLDSIVQASSFPLQKWHRFPLLYLFFKEAFRTKLINMSVEIKQYNHKELSQLWVNKSNLRPI